MIQLLNFPYAPSEKINSEQLKQNLDTLLLRQDLGYLDLTNRPVVWDSSAQLAKRLLAEFERIVLVGFGGSSMSARAIVDITRTQNVLFLDNVDMVENSAVLTEIDDLNQTAFVFISKSGNTIEVLTLLDFLKQYVDAQDINFDSKTFFISEQKESPLFDYAKKNARPCLDLPLDVGGRFSALSPSGLLIAGLCGLDLNLIRQGAQEALADKKAVLYAAHQYLSSFADGKNITLFWFYNSAMRWFGGWLQQLWAESLGKKSNRRGAPAHPFSTPMIAIGSSDQHSILQQVMDGEKNKFVTFFRFDHVEKFGEALKISQFKETAPLLHKSLGTLIAAQAQGTAEALVESGIPQMTLQIESLDELHLGYLFMYFQLIVSLVAEYHDVNAFDQPGVQLGKLKTVDKLK